MANGLLSLFFLLTLHKNPGLRDSDTLYYNGLIAIEMANTMQYKDGGQDDAINIYNVSNCQGFVLFRDKITGKNYEHSFFPLGLCDLKASLKEVSDNNSKFYDTIFDNIKEKGESYREVIHIKGEGDLSVNYKIIKVSLWYVISGTGVLDKYIRQRIQTKQALNIESNICKIIKLKVGR